MNAVAAHQSGLLYAVCVGIPVAWLAMAASIVFHESLKSSGMMYVVALVGLAAAVAGTYGGLKLASARRNVMWVLPVALAATAAMALLAAALVPVVR